MITENDKFYQVKYCVSEFKIIIDGEIIELYDNNVGTMSIENDYEGSLHPIFRIPILTTRSIYNKIIQAKNRCKFKVRIQKYNMTIDGKKSAKSDFLNDTFVIFHDLNDPMISGNLIKEKYKVLKEKEQNPQVLTELNTSFELFLFKENHVNNLNKKINMVVQSTNLTQMIAYLLNVGGYSNVLMSPLMNARTYNELILPPLSIIEQLLYLDRHYGFYVNGAMIYFGLDHPYILNIYKGTPTAWKVNEWKETSIIILNENTHHHNIPAMFSRGSEKVFYLNVNGTGINIYNDSIVSNVVGGTDVKAVDGYNDTSFTGTSSAMTKNGVNYNKNIQNESMNTFLASTYAMREKSKSILIDVSFSDINYEALNPNKKFNIIFEDPKLNATYKGVYAIAKSRIVFKKEGNEFRFTAIGTFRKIV